MAYEPQQWEDLPAKTTPFSAERMLHIEGGVKAVSDDVDSLVSEVNTLAQDVEEVDAYARFSTPAASGPIMGVASPVFSKLPQPVITTATMGMNSMYFPTVLRVDKTRPNFGAKYVMFVSTDHDETGGGIFMAESNDLVTWVPTTKKPGALVYADTMEGTQTESPSVWYQESEDLFFMLYQQKGAVTGRVAGQVTLLATSPDLVNWTRVGIAIDTYANGDFISAEGHTGYARISKHGRALMARHLLTGGIYYRHATSYSLDGRRWKMDPIPIERSPHLASDVNRGLILYDVFQYRGEWWGFGEDRNIEGGFNRFPIIGRVTPDLTRFTSPPTPVALPTESWESGYFKGGHVYAEGGRVFLFYNYGNSIGLAISQGIES